MSASSLYVLVTLAFKGPISGRVNLYCCSSFPPAVFPLKSLRTLVLLIKVVTRRDNWGETILIKLPFA